MRNCLTRSRHLIFLCLQKGSSARAAAAAATTAAVAPASASAALQARLAPAGGAPGTTAAAATGASAAAASTAGASGRPAGNSTAAANGSNGAAGASQAPTQPTRKRLQPTPVGGAQPPPAAAAQPPSTAAQPPPAKRLALQPLPANGAAHPPPPRPAAPHPAAAQPPGAPQPPSSSLAAAHPHQLPVPPVPSSVSVILGSRPRAPHDVGGGTAKRGSAPASSMHQERVVLEAVNQVRDAQGREVARLTCSAGGRALWTDVVRGGVLAVAGTLRFAAAATAAGDLLVFSAAGRRVLPPLSLGAPALLFGHDGEWSVVILTADLQIR